MDIQEEIKKPAVSASMITSYSMCGEAYRRRYIDKDIRPSSLAATKGTVFHSLAQFNNKYKLEKRVDQELDVLQDYVAQKVDEAFQDEIYLTPDEKTVGKDGLKDQSMFLLTSIAPEYKMNNNLIMPRAVETPERLVLPNSDQDILFTMDIETMDDDIVDYKFTKKKKSQNDVNQNLGLTAYSLAFYSRHKKLPRKVAFHNYGAYVTPARQELKTFFNPLYATRDVVDFQNFLQRSTEMLKAIKAGIFMPAAIGSWNCSSKWCQYYGDCKFVNSARTEAAKDDE